MRFGGAMEGSAEGIINGSPTSRAAPGDLDVIAAAAPLAVLG